MKKLIMLLLTLTLILGIFSSCNSKRYLPVDDETSSSPSEDKTSETNDTGAVTTTVLTQDTLDITSETQPIEYPEDYHYTIKEIDGKWYMVFDSYETPGIYKPGIGLQIVPEIEITSFHELYDNIINQKFDKNTLMYIIDRWGKTEYGTPIINFDTLYVPTIPSSMVFSDKCQWYKDNYTLWIEDVNDESVYASVSPIKKEKYDEVKNNILDDIYINGKGVDDGKYIITTDNKTVIVDMPLMEIANIYVNQGNGYLQFCFYGFTEMPSDDFLLGLGMEKFQISQ